MIALHECARFVRNLMSYHSINFALMRNLSASDPVNEIFIVSEESQKQYMKSKTPNSLTTKAKKWQNNKYTSGKQPHARHGSSLTMSSDR